MSTSIWKDIGEPTSPNISYIQTKLTSEYMIGQLNNLINSCYQMVSGCFVPELTADETAIYGALYKQQYYQKMAAQTLGAIGAMNWTEVREGDSVVRRVNTNETSKIFAQLAKDIKTDLDNQIDRYKRNRSQPVSVDYLNIDQYGRSYPLGDRDYRPGSY